MWLITVLGVVIGGINGLVGAGGSFLTVLLLVHVGGIELGSAVATSLVVVGGMSLVGLVPYAFEGAVRWRAALGFGLPSMAGAFLGGIVATLVSSQILLVTFLLTMMLAAAAMLWPRAASIREAPCKRMHHVTVATTGLVIGSLGGMVGLGGGFAVVPLLTVVEGFSIRAAVGTSLVVIVMTKIAGIAGHLPHHLAIDWRTALYLGLAESVGSLAGARLAKRLSGRALRTIFATVMLMVAVYLLGRAVLQPAAAEAGTAQRAR